ncbi:carboxypeptidase regulatory-like domain-containing protein [bacterium]|nr:carboxypeptidase regulatory-like domain-containing protein [bacterium]
MHAGTHDFQAPIVTDYQPTGEGVLPDRNIEFIIYDDYAGVDESSIYVEVAGVDVTSDLELTEITYGYYPAFEVFYDPPGDFPYCEEICVNIWAQDLADPVHVMDTFTYCFRIMEFEWGIPPYTEDWNPMNEEMGVGINTDISVKIKDGGVGVNDESIIMKVNGIDVTADLMISAIDHPLSGNYLVVYTPEAILPSHSWINVWVYAEDLNGNAMTDSISFMTGPCPDGWEALITVWSKLGSDTTLKELTFGGWNTCENGYDDCDVPVICLPGRVCMYFMLDDSVYPGIDKLRTDIRDYISTTAYWRINVENPGDDLGAFWDPEGLIDEPSWCNYIGTAYYGEDPDTWINMDESDSLSVEVGQHLHIHIYWCPCSWDLYGTVTLEGETDFTETHVYWICEGETLATGITDIGGDFCFLDYYWSTYTVCFHHEGYYDSCLTIDLDEDILLDEIMLRLICYPLSGIITLEGLTDHSGVEVILTSPSQAETTYTDTEGYYLIDCLIPGTYTISASYECYETVVETVNINEDTTVDLELPQLLVDIYGYVSLEGATVYDNIEVCLDGDCIITRRDGGFEFTDMECGDDHVITASLDCYFTLVETLFNVTADSEYNFELPVLPHGTNIVARTDTLARPVIDETLSVTLYWTEPIDCDSIAIFYTTVYSDYIGDWDLAATLPAGSGMGDTGLRFTGLYPDTVYCVTIVPFFGPHYCSHVIEYACEAATTLPDPSKILIYDFDNGATPCR